MKEQILKKIGKTLVRINVTDQSAEDAYNELVNSSPRLFGMLSSIYRLNDEEESSLGLLESPKISLRL